MKAENKMQRVNAILTHPIFIEYLQKNIASEAGYIYCKHSMAHFLDVARIAYIISLEENLDFPKEIIYATALLHDITKWLQQAEGIPHNKSAVEPAAEILRDCGFKDEEVAMACAAIRKHRKKREDGDKFSEILYRADKMSRDCYSCESESTCYWDKKMKNTPLRY